MSSENLHAPRERLSKEALTLHHAIVSLMEELDAIDWYRQRSEDAEDEALKGLLLHNMREEMEHASMLLEYIRRADSDFDRVLKTYLFTKEPILEIEDEAKESGGESERDKGKRRDRSEGAPEGGFTVGPLKAS